MWELVIFMGISWAGIGSASYNPMPDKDTCFQALDSMKINNGTVGSHTSGEASKSNIAFCRFIEKESPKGK